MTPEERDLLRRLLTGQRLIALAVIVEGSPAAGLLPFVPAPDGEGLLVHVSALARHARGLTAGAPYSGVIHLPDRPDQDPLQVPRVTLEGRAVPLVRHSPAYEAGRAAYLARLPGAAMTFSLSDFQLIVLGLERGRLVAGFARARTVSAEALRAVLQP